MTTRKGGLQKLYCLLHGNTDPNQEVIPNLYPSSPKSKVTVLPVSCQVCAKFGTCNVMGLL